MENKEPVKLPEGKLCRWLLCGDCKYFKTGSYDKSGYRGECSLWEQKYNSLRFVNAADDACSDFDYAT